MKTIWFHEEDGEILRLEDEHRELSLDADFTLGEALTYICNFLEDDELYELYGVAQ